MQPPPPRPSPLQKTQSLSHRSRVSDIMVRFPCSVTVIFRKKHVFLCPERELFVKRNVSLCFFNALRISLGIQHNHKVDTLPICWDIQGSLKKKKKDMTTDTLMPRNLFSLRCVHGTWVADGKHQTPV